MTMLGLYLLCMKYGLLCFGGGYVLVPLLTNDLVAARQLMTAEEFARLVAIAQVTPGPIGINTATYVGYKLFGVCGATVGTLGLLTPALALMLLAMACIRKYENALPIAGALAGLRPGAFGLILAAVVVFAEISIFPGRISWEIRWVPLLIAVISAVVQIRTRFSFVKLIILAAIAGALLKLH